MIPKIIHYCWFGRGAKPSTFLVCFDSWRRLCPDYELMEWNEDNAPMDVPWVKDAYRHRKYAFVADYVRFYVLEKYGGIYLDTDMLLIKNLDAFLRSSVFMGREDEYNVNMGIIGAEKGSQFCRDCLALYNHSKFDVVSPPIITRFITPSLLDKGLLQEDIIQNLNDGIVVYSRDYFYPIHYSREYNMSELMDYVKPETVGIHLWNKSWNDEFHYLDNGDYKKGFRLAVGRVFRTPFLPFRYWKKLAKYFFRYIGLAVK